MANPPVEWVINQGWWFDASYKFIAAVDLPLLDVNYELKEVINCIQVGA